MSNLSLFVEKGYVAGAWTTSNKTFPVIDLVTDKVIANVIDYGLDHF